MFENTCVTAEAVGNLSKVRSVYECMQRESWKMVDSMAQMETAQEVEDHLTAYSAHHVQLSLCFEVLLGCNAVIREQLGQHGEEFFDVLNAFNAESQQWHEDVCKR